MKLGDDVDVHAGRHVELTELVDGLSIRLNDFNQTLVRADFKLVHRLFVDVGRTVHRETLNGGRQRIGPETRAPVRFAVSTISLAD